MILARHGRQLTPRIVQLSPSGRTPSCGASGLLFGVLIWITNGIYPVDWFGIGDPWMAAAVGIVSGFAATGLHQAVKQHTKEIDKLAEDEGGEWR